MPDVSSAGNAAAARAKAMYGKRITRKQYQQLTAAHTVGEIASFLRSNTTYAAALSDIQDTTVHRGVLEQVLRRKVAMDLEKLTGYDEQIDRLVTMYHRQQIEISWILRWLRAKTEEEDDTWFLSTAITAVASKLQPVRMNLCKTVAELEAELQDTPYAKVLHRFAGSPTLPTVTALENALISDRNARLFAATEELGGSCEAELKALIGSGSDAQNFCRIWRLKRYFHAAPAQIRTELLPSGTNISPKIWDAIIEAPTEKAAAEMFFETPFGRQIPPAERENVDTLPEKIPYLKARQAMYFSAHALVICMAFAMLSEVELHNLIHIVEGTRYQMSAAEITKFIIFDDRKGGSGGWL